MRKTINQELLQKEWTIETWYEKTYYIVGIVVSWFFIASFVVGFIQGLTS